MTREELHTFAAAGIALKLVAIERELAAFHKEWPELFLSPTAPQLLKAPTKNGSNGHWPPIAPTPDRAAAISATWTPARRAKQARLMKKVRSKQMHIARRAKRAAAKATRPTRVWSAASRRKMALAMKRRHASGEIARAKAAAAKAKAHGE